MQQVLDDAITRWPGVYHFPLISGHFLCAASRYRMSPGRLSSGPEARGYARGGLEQCSFQNWTGGVSSETVLSRDVDDEKVGDLVLN